MERLKDNKYIKKNVTKTWLHNNGFRYNKIVSDDSIEGYSRRFTVYRYNLRILLECEMIIFLQTGEVRLNVFDGNTRDIYAPFYCSEYGGKNAVLEQINDKIKREMKKLGIEERETKNECD